MSNHHFQFKQFKIEQEQCAMKVSTDACIQGAWAPLPEGTTSVLDVGCGTGLLSLMLAQRYANVQIDAIELDERAATQARENVAASPWANRINIITADARSFNPGKQYDFIICNPPFFSNSLKGPEAQRNAARHNITLQQEDLVALMAKLLTANGRACFMWPVHTTWLKLCAHAGYHPCNTLQVQDKKDARISRCISVHSRQSCSEKKEILLIHEGDRTYTHDFTALLQSFYIKL